MANVNNARFRLVETIVLPLVLYSCRYRQEYLVVSGLKNRDKTIAKGIGLVRDGMETARCGTFQNGLR